MPAQEAHKVLLHDTVVARVPRFIPSYHAINFTKLQRGTNRQLDLRQKFHERLGKTPVSVITVLNGMFTVLLAGQAPAIATIVIAYISYIKKVLKLIISGQHNPANTKSR